MALQDTDTWAQRTYYGGDLPADAEKHLHLAALAWDAPEKAEAELADAMIAAPGHLAVHLAHYKYYLYKHRFADAAPHALACVGIAAKRLGLPADWHLVRKGDADFDRAEGSGEDSDCGRLWLFSLAAYGYVTVRSGAVTDGRAALLQVAQLDGTGQTGAQSVLDSLDRGPDPDDDEDD